MRKRLLKIKVKRGGILHLKVMSVVHVLLNVLLNKFLILTPF